MKGRVPYNILDVNRSVFDSTIRVSPMGNIMALDIACKPGIDAARAGIPAARVRYIAPPKDR